MTISPSPTATSEIQTITYAGHSAVILHGKQSHGAPLVIAIDPWLAGNPLCPADLKHPEHLDVIVLTHGHLDHSGDAVALAKRTKAKVAATYELAMIMGGEGLADEQLLPMNKGGTITYAGVHISLTHALHSSSFDSPSRGTLYAGEACGIVVADRATSIYHAGDTSLFSDMTLIAQRHRPDIALLPIGDRFTMDPSDAACAASLLKTRVAIPIHYGTFPLLTGTPEQFEREAHQRDVRAHVLAPGSTISLADLLGSPADLRK